MKRNSMLTIVLFVLLVAMLVLACGALSGGETPTPMPTNTSVPTNTPVPTNSPTPSPVPSPTEDPLYVETLAQVQKFVEAGHIPSADGKYIKLDDFNKTFAQLGYYQSHPLGLEIESFVFIGHVKWETAAPTSDVSGCGVLFAQQEDTSDYAVFLDKSRIYFSSSTPKFYSELGKTRGTGRLSFGNPAEADLSLVVYDNHAYVYVDDNFIGEYALSKDKVLRGIFGYGIISGTNRDFGTRCQITDARVWDLNPLADANPSDEANWAVDFDYNFPTPFWSVGTHEYTLKSVCPSFPEVSGSFTLSFKVSDNAALVHDPIQLRLSGLFNSGDGSKIDTINPGQTTIGEFTIQEATKADIDKMITECKVSITWDGGSPQTLAPGELYQR